MGESEEGQDEQRYWAVGALSAAAPAGEGVAGRLQGRGERHGGWGSQESGREAKQHEYQRWLAGNLGDEVGEMVGVGGFGIDVACTEGIYKLNVDDDITAVFYWFAVSLDLIVAKYRVSK